MLRVLHIDTGNELRGGQRQLVTLARGLRKQNHYQVIVCPQGSGLEALARREEFETFSVSFRGAGTVSTIFELRNLIRSRNIGIIHAHDGRGQTFSWLASRGTRIRRVANRRVIFQPRGRIVHRLKYSLTCQGIIAVSRFIREVLLQFGIPATKIEVIPDGIELPLCLPNAEERIKARSRFNLTADDFIIGHAGAFSTEKGQEIAIQAFHLLFKRLPRARLLLAGDGKLRSPLVDKYQLRDPNGPIRLLGYLDDLAAFMHCLDLFIMPSLSEGLGSAALVAMAHGVPVVASRTGGLPEIVDHGINGWLVTPGSAGDLAEQILTAASQPELLRRMSLQAREKASLFTNDIMVQKTEAFYRRLMG